MELQLWVWCGVGEIHNTMKARGASGKESAGLGFEFVTEGPIGLTRFRKKSFPGPRQHLVSGMTGPCVGWGGDNGLGRDCTHDFTHRTNLRIELLKVLRP